MLRFRETLVQKSLTMRKRFVYLKNGKSSWNQSLSSRVSLLTNFIFAESRGNTIHLLKQKTKPMTKRAPRKKYSLFEHSQHQETL